MICLESSLRVKVQLGIGLENSRSNLTETASIPVCTQQDYPGDLDSRLDLIPISCVALDKSLLLSGPQLSHLQREGPGLEGPWVHPVPTHLEIRLGWAPLWNGKGEWRGVRGESRCPIPALIDSQQLPLMFQWGPRSVSKWSGLVRDGEKEYQCPGHGRVEPGAVCH